MSVPFRIQVIIAAAALGCVALTVVAVTLLPRNSSYGTADLLPAEQTLLYARNLDHAGADKLSAFIPLLRDAPVTDVASDIAQVQMPDGSTAWITMRQAAGGKPAVTATDQRALALLGGEHPLSADRDYRALARMDGQTPVFVRPEGLPAPMHATRPAIAVRSGSGIRLAFSAPMLRLSPAETLVREMPGLTLSLQAGDGSMFAKMLGGLLQKDERTVADAIIRQKVSAFIGPDLSPAYDLLPLLEGPTTLYAVKADGPASVAFEGTANNASDRVAVLHDAFRSARAPVARTQRTFDDEFTFDSLSADAEASSDDITTDGGWTIRSSANGDRGLHSAIMGSRFMISTDKDLLLSLIRAPVNASADTGTALVRGSADTGGLRRMFTDNGFTPGLLALLPSGSGSVRWELGKEGNLAVLTVY